MGACQAKEQNFLQRQHTIKQKFPYCQECQYNFKENGEEHILDFEQHFSLVHLTIYDENSKLFYCKFGDCDQAEQDYKKIELHAIETHLSKLEKFHHIKFKNNIKTNKIGLNKNGSEGYFCTYCSILYENREQHELISSHSNLYAPQNHK